MHEPQDVDANTFRYMCGGEVANLLVVLLENRTTQNKKILVCVCSYRPVFLGMGLLMSFLRVTHKLY